MQQQTCDCCGFVVRDAFPPGWGHFHGTDQLGQLRTRDFCPRCSAVLQLAIGELQRKLGPKPKPTVTAEGEEVERKLFG